MKYDNTRYVLLSYGIKDKDVLFQCSGVECSLADRTHKQKVACHVLKVALSQK